MNDHAIAENVLDHFDREKYGLRWVLVVPWGLWLIKLVSSRSVRRIRTQELKLLGARQQARLTENLDELLFPIYFEVRRRFPNLGARGFVTHLRQHYGIKLSEFVISFYLSLPTLNYYNRRTILDFFRRHDRDGIARRKYKKFKRKRFHCAGVMDLLTIDQHDKYKRWGLFFHVAQDPFSGRLAWMHVWWTNRNPVLIASYYIRSARKVKGSCNLRIFRSPDLLQAYPL